jgi:hypothetical protein
MPLNTGGIGVCQGGSWVPIEWVLTAAPGSRGIPDGGGGQQPQQPQPKPRGPACGLQLAQLAANAVVDAVSIVGIFSGVGLVAQGVGRLAAGALLNVSARSVGTLGFQVAGRQALLRTAAAAGASSAAEGAYIAGVGGLGATIARSPELTLAMAFGSSSAGLSWTDFIPGSGTWQAWKSWRRCRNRG